MARKLKPKSGQLSDAALKYSSLSPSELGPFPEKMVPARYKTYVRHAGYRCEKCSFQSAKKNLAGKQALRAHKRRHIRARKAWKLGILAALVIAGLIASAVAYLLDAVRFLPVVEEQLHPILLALLALSVTVFVVSVMLLDARSIRREFYRALMALAPVVVSALALALVEPPVDPFHPLLPSGVLWSPLLAALAVVMALPKMAKSWNTTGLNPRLRPEYEELVEFKNKGAVWAVEASITRLEFQAVSGLKFLPRSYPGNSQVPEPELKIRALGELKKVREMRTLLMERDPHGMDIKRGQHGRDNKETVLKMANLKL